jgi:hypothetical protein
LQGQLRLEVVNDRLHEGVSIQATRIDMAKGTLGCIWRALSIDIERADRPATGCATDAARPTTKP